MKYYHTSKLENLEDIENEGIFTGMSRFSTCSGETLHHKEGVYLFTDLSLAEAFGTDQNYDFVVFEVEYDGKSLSDPEYDNGDAIFVETDGPIAVVGVVLTREVS